MIPPCIMEYGRNPTSEAFRLYLKVKDVLFQGDA